MSSPLRYEGADWRRVSIALKACAWQTRIKGDRLCEVFDAVLSEYGLDPEDGDGYNLFADMARACQAHLPYSPSQSTDPRSWDIDHPDLDDLVAPMFDRAAETAERWANGEGAP